MERLRQRHPAVPNRLPSVGASWLLTRTMCVLEPKRKQRWEEGPDGQRKPEGDAGGSLWAGLEAARGQERSRLGPCSVLGYRLPGWLRGPGCPSEVSGVHVKGLYPSLGRGVW